MGGFQVSHFRFKQFGGRAKEIEKPEDIDAGYDHIERYAPRSRAHCKQLRWMDKEVNNPDGPLYQWSIARITSALASLRQCDQQAETEE